MVEEARDHGHGAAAFLASAIVAGYDTAMRDLPEAFDAMRLLRLMQEHAQRNAIKLPDGVMEALDLAYQVSMHAEEGRPLLVAFAVTRKGQKLKGELILQPPVREFEDLRRLAPGAGRDWLCARFGRDPDGRWSVLSVAPRQEFPPMLADLAWGNIAFVETGGPGCVVLKVNDHEVRYARGRYVTFDPIGSIRAILPSFMPEAMAAPILAPFANRHDHQPPYVDVDEHAYAHHYDAFADEVRDVAGIVAADGVYFIAEYTNRLRHGGTLLVAENPNALFGATPLLGTARHTMSPIQDVDKRWNAAMLEALEWESHRRLARKGVTVLAGLNKEFQGGDGLKRWIDGPGNGRIGGCLKRWNGDAHRCAELTQMDGVTVFDRLLHPVAIGVKVLNVTDEVVEKLPSEFREVALGRGLRHQSAACAVAALRGSLALVVSQDGHVTAFAHGTDGTLTHRRIM